MRSTSDEVFDLRAKFNGLEFLVRDGDDYLRTYVRIHVWDIGPREAEIGRANDIAMLPRSRPTGATWADPRIGRDVGWEAAYLGVLALDDPMRQHVERLMEAGDLDRRPNTSVGREPVAQHAETAPGMLISELLGDVDRMLEENQRWREAQG